MMWRGNKEGMGEGKREGGEHMICTRVQNHSYKIS